MNRLKKALVCALAGVLPALAGETPTDDAPAKPASEIEQLKEMLLNQQKQIDELRRQLAAQQGTHVGLGEVATTTPVIPASATPAPAPSPVFNPPAVIPPPAPAPQTTESSSPLQFKLGDAYFTPVGFMDMTSVTRSTNPGSGIGTNFGSIPYANTQAGSLTESRLSPQNSRLGMRIDALVKDWKILGYWESDFLGQINNPPNGGLAVSSNPYVFRLRLYWVDVRKKGFEFLAGQSWSLLTPNRRGISPLPGDIFYSQDIDVNYQAGLVWGRIPGFRFGYHFNDKAAFAVALENSEPYVGGGNGGSAITLPAWVGAANATSGAILGGQINNGSSTISAAALHPDIIAKLAFDPTSKFHFEIAGVEITNKVSNPTTTPAFQTFSKAGGAGAVNFSFEFAKGVRFLTNNYWGAGGGRYIFGQAPDFMLRGDGSISLVRAGSTVTGIEGQAGKTLLYAYYGGVYIGKNLARDLNGSLIGYGPISSDGQNRTIQEITFGSNTTLMRDPKWGAINLMFQYSYLQRNPWLVTGTAPTDAHVHMGFVNLRYTLPGSAPTLGK